jgi:hypothetical protein
MKPALAGCGWVEIVVAAEPEETREAEALTPPRQGILAKGSY